MRSLLSVINTYSLEMPRGLKAAIFVVLDVCATLAALYAAYALRLSELWPVDYLLENVVILAVSPPVMVGMLWALGFYRGMVRYIELNAMGQVVIASGVTVLGMYAAGLMFRLDPFPRSVPLIFGPLVLLFVGLSRGVALSYFRWAIDLGLDRERILVIGRLAACLRVADAMKRSDEYHVVGLIDVGGNRQASAAGYRVFDLEDMGEHVSVGGIGSVVVALDGLGGEGRKGLLKRLSGYDVRVRLVPSIEEFVGQGATHRFRDVELADLLGRDEVPPVPALVAASVSGQTVMVTGAGGSIGSEICRQCLSMGVGRLVLVEASEYNLYQVESELREVVSQMAQAPEIIPQLFSVLEHRRLEDAMRGYGVDTVYHAAAYKHVPLLEANPDAAFENNSLGSWLTAMAAVRAAVRRFVLVSTDKAVRPTNVMGASKRLAELAVEAVARSHAGVKFSAVRFGNVLGSSGSVIPRFNQQIRSGGPVTVTDPEVTRYFMTIPEAAGLVIQAGSMSEDWALFVLDMGEPVKIRTLAEQLIHLTGNVVRNESNPGGIAIEYVGLRPGEKLYEELSITGELEPTVHPKISLARDGCPFDAAMIERIMADIQSGGRARGGELLDLLVSPAVSYTGGFGKAPGRG